jgi:uncharacterized protein
VNRSLSSPSWWGAVALWAAFVLLVARPAWGWEPPAGELQRIPALTARVTDATGTLTAAQKATLERDLEAAEAKTGNQVAVLIVPTTKPEAIEDYSIRVVEQWKLGAKNVDNGVLFIVAKDDRRMRIEVGYGLEGVLPDVVAKRLLDETVAPRFRQGDFAGGIAAGVARIHQVLATGTAQAAPGARVGPRAPPPGGGAGAVDLVPLLVFAFLIVPVVGGVLRAVFGRVFGSLIGGAGTGALAWIFTGSLLFGIAAAVIALLIISVSGAGAGRLAHSRGTRGWTRGGWGGGLGGGLGGGGGWSGGGGGGWSGGGGGFGGGGASSSW